LDTATAVVGGEFQVGGVVEEEEEEGGR